jgi:hypothetical protein
MRPAGGTAEARERFARTFADVLSRRFGGRWTVEWEGAARAELSSGRGRKPLAREGKLARADNKTVRSTLCPHADREPA